MPRRELREFLGDDVDGTTRMILLRNIETGEVVPQKVIIIAKGVTPEVIAHEAGHIVLKHHYGPEPQDWREYISKEMEAWRWAEKKRNRRLRSSYISDIALTAVDFYRAKPNEVVEEMKKYVSLPEATWSKLREWLMEAEKTWTERKAKYERRVGGSL